MNAGTPRITAFIGVMGSGKDYKANELLQSDPSYVRVDFKDALLDMCSDLVGWDVRTDYDWFRAAPVGMRPPKDAMEKLLVLNRVEHLGAASHTGRDVMQRLGTEVMRKRDPDHWVDEWEKKAKAALKYGRNVVVADCRFWNEITAITNMSTSNAFIFCDFYSERYNGENQHASEYLAQHFRQRYGDGEYVPMTQEILNYERIAKDCSCHLCAKERTRMRRQ